MSRATKNVCGVIERGVSNPCLISREEEIEELNASVNEALNERNQCITAVNTTLRLVASPW